MARKNDFEDDGRTIASMDYVSRPSPFLGRDPMLPRTKDEARKFERKTDENVPPVSKEERSAMVRGALMSALLIGAVFIVGIGAVILLMDILL